MKAAAILGTTLRSVLVGVPTGLMYAATVGTPVPEGWSMQVALGLGLTCAGLLGLMMRMVSRELRTTVAGSFVGVLFGANRACVSDTFLSWWQRVECGILFPYSLGFWAFVVAGWALAHLATARIFRVRSVA
jgi:hypothetical protein